MRENNFSNDPILRAKQKRMVKKKIIIALITSFAAILAGVGFLLLIIGSQMENTYPFIISGGIIGGLGVVTLIFMVIFYYNFPI